MGGITWSRKRPAEESASLPPPFTLHDFTIKELAELLRGRPRASGLRSLSGAALSESRRCCFMCRPPTPSRPARWGNVARRCNKSRSIHHSGRALNPQPPQDGRGRGRGAGSLIYSQRGMETSSLAASFCLTPTPRPSKRSFSCQRKTPAVGF